MDLEIITTLKETRDEWVKMEEEDKIGVCGFFRDDVTEIFEEMKRKYQDNPNSLDSMELRAKLEQSLKTTISVDSIKTYSDIIKVTCEEINDKNFSNSFLPLIVIMLELNILISKDINEDTKEYEIAITELKNDLELLIGVDSDKV